MAHYSLNDVKLAFDAQYKLVILALLTYLWLWPWPQGPLVLALALKMLASNSSLHCNGVVWLLIVLLFLGGTFLFLLCALLVIEWNECRQLSMSSLFTC